MTAIRFHLLLALVPVLAGCGSTPVEDRYYSLVLAAEEDGAARPADNRNVHVVVGPVQLPDYLQQRGIALQTGGNEIRPASHNFWAEPLDEAIAKLLVHDLARHDENLVVERDAGRWTGSSNCRLRIEFDRFHATSEGGVVSSGRYWIVTDGSTVREQFSVSRPQYGDGYGESVAALRATLDTVAAQVAEQLDSRSLCRN